MCIRRTQIAALCVIVFMIVNGSFAGGSETDPYPSIDIPVYPEGYNLEQAFDPAKQTKSLSYLLRTTPSPNGLIEFYDAYLIGRGWRSSFEICQRDWEDRSGSETADEPSTKQLFASWQHLEHQLKLDLWVQYTRADRDRPYALVIRCYLQPLGD